MKRAATDALLKWVNSSHRKPLMVWGARQVGKTYLVYDLFAKEHFKERNVYIDFKRDDDVREFCERTADAKKIVEFLSLRENIQIDENCLLIFDEVQECPNVVSSLKYFCQDLPQIPVIATGSMVRIKLQRISRQRGENSGNKFLFPIGKIDQIILYPMTFDEFLMNSNPVLFNRLEKAYEDKEVLEPGIHKLACDELFKFLLVGGMPEAVQRFLDDGNLQAAREILSALYDNYLADMELHQASPEAILRSRALFRSVYKQLNKESKNFSPGLVEEKAKTRDFATSIQWLTMAHVLHQSFQLPHHITLPLIPKIDSHFRLFLADVGMFAYQSGINPSSFISGEANTLSGIFFENYVANELVAKGNSLFYWRGKRSAEIEFIVQSGEELFPLEVKKNKVTMNSLNKFAENNSFRCAIKVSQNNYGFDESQKLLTMPLYMMPFLSRDLAAGSFS